MITSQYWDKGLNARRRAERILIRATVTIVSRRKELKRPDRLAGQFNRPAQSNTALVAELEQEALNLQPSEVPLKYALTFYR